jgi:hypothetical protein
MVCSYNISYVQLSRILLVDNNLMPFVIGITIDFAVLLINLLQLILPLIHWI